MGASNIDNQTDDLQTPHADSRVRVVCIGETMLMFAPPPHELIEYSDEFRAFLGGAESNVAIGLERLGMHAGWIGKLPTNALGRRIVNEMRSFGVDTRAVVWSPNGRVGTFFVEWGAAPRPVKTIYDRADSAATTLSADELDWDYIMSAEWVSLTGITPALSPSCREALLTVARRARQAGRSVLVDLNYRALIWSQAEARAAYDELLPFANLVVATESDYGVLLGKVVGREEALQTVTARYPVDAAVMTIGAEGSLAYDGQQFLQTSGYEVQTVNRLGAGDAFVAGLLYGYTHWDLPTGLRYGSAMAALKLTIPQNIPLVDKDDVERLLRDSGLQMLR